MLVWVLVLELADVDNYMPAAVETYVASACAVVRRESCEAADIITITTARDCVGWVK